VAQVVEYLPIKLEALSSNLLQRKKPRGAVLTASVPARLASAEPPGQGEFRPAACRSRAVPSPGSDSGKPTADCAGPPRPASQGAPGIAGPGRAALARNPLCSGGGGDTTPGRRSAPLPSPGACPPQTQADQRRGHLSFTMGPWCWCNWMDLWSPPFQFALLYSHLSHSPTSLGLKQTPASSSCPGWHASLWVSAAR
jgi:hypothetical protein